MRNKKFLTFLIMFFLGGLSVLHAATQPKFSIIPTTSTNISLSTSAVVQYKVTNNTLITRTLTMVPIQGITPITAGAGVCSDPFILAQGQSCLLTLLVEAQDMVTSRINEGPVICKTMDDYNNNPDPFLCSQASRINSLHISLLNYLTVDPANLSFAVGGNGVITVTNSGHATSTANNITVIPGSSGNISVVTNNCPAALRPAENCTIVFEASDAQGATNFTVQGDNTNSVDITVAANLVQISANPQDLTLIVDGSGSITVANDINSTTTANNIQPSIPGGSGIILESTTCLTNLAPGASCTLTFSGTQEVGPTIVPIQGTNTNAVDVTITVQEATISVTSPVQEERTIEVGSIDTLLDLVITNNMSSSATALNINVTDKTACANVVVTNTGCASVAPGASCTLHLSSPTPYAPCNITIAGSNTDSFTTPIAFQYLNGLVYQASADGSTGKIVRETEFSTSWTIGNANLPDADSASDGVANTNVIVADIQCTNNPAACAALSCRDTFGANWYLPAYQEIQTFLSTLCSNEDIPCNFGGFTAGTYWSSTYVPTFEAYVVSSPEGARSPDAITDSNNVRCTRNF